MRRLAIIVDWGTSLFRAWLMDVESGEKLDEIAHGKGLRDLTTPEFPVYCRQQLEPWRERAGLPPIYMAGMVGSAQGWQMAPQLPLPIRVDDLTAHLTPAEGVEDAWIIPGCRHLDRHGVADLMRGEEAQIFGALLLAKRAQADLCLPGTHSKWARVDDCALVQFATSMSGEVYGTLIDHSLLGRPAVRGAAFSEAAFRKGLEQAEREGGLLHHLFTVRSRHVHGDLAAEDIASYLSGVLIGHEVMEQAKRCRGEVVLVCAPTLKTPYEIALDAQGLRPAWIASADASTAGMCEIIRRHEPPVDQP